jgi:hypothetical protein
MADKLRGLWGTMSEHMSDVISEYQKWKQQGDDLRLRAKHAMESRFRELLIEAVQISGEYRADFGSVLKPPSSVTSFRYKADVKKKAAKTKSAAKPERVEPKAEPAPPKPSRKIIGLQTRLATAKRKLEEAKAAGSATRALDDKIYEIEDELRLALQPAK